jgi:hypothetical protein
MTRTRTSPRELLIVVVTVVAAFIGSKASCPGPAPTPTPTPTATPTPEPTPTPTLPPPVSACPKELAPGAEVYMNAKNYGQGFDSTVRVKGDPMFCSIVHGEPINDCHLEGWPGRVECEMELIRGCPIWRGVCYSETPQDGECPVEFDHMGNTEYRDDPATPTTGDTLENLRGFEGQPKVCGLQRVGTRPIAGFFAIAHGKGKVQACRPDGGGCSVWREVDH